MKNKKKRFQVRFHLGKGENYMCWQVKDFGVNRGANNGKANIDYYAPSNVALELTNCTLRNSPSTAMKIYNGQAKTVCAWVECDMIDVRYKKSPDFERPPIKNMDKYKYNPRKHMHWFTKRQRNADNKDLKKMFTNNRALYGQVSKIPAEHSQG